MISLTVESPTEDSSNHAKISISVTSKPAVLSDWLPLATQPQICPDSHQHLVLYKPFPNLLTYLITYVLTYCTLCLGIGASDLERYRNDARTTQEVIGFLKRENF